MKPGLAMMWAGTVVAALGAVGVTGVRAARANGHAEAATGELRTVAMQAERVRLLREATRGAGEGERGASLAQRVTDALASAGLASGALSNLSPESELSVRAAPSGPATLRRRATLTLGSITLPQVGSFLAAWREREPVWSVASVELSPEHGRGSGPAEQGGDLPLRAVVVVETFTLSAHGGDPR